MNEERKLAVVTGASRSIGLELARLCAKSGFDLVIAGDEPLIEAAANELRQSGCRCTAVQTDLSRTDGVDRLIEATDKTGRPVDALLVNATQGPGRAFLDQRIDEALKLAHTNVDSTVYLIHRIGQDMRDRGTGRILIMGSIAGLARGASQAVYNGTKAFLDSFSVALSSELKNTGVTITCLMPSVTEFLKRADLLDTKGSTSVPASAAHIAKTGFDAMMEGEFRVVDGFVSKLRAAVSHTAADSSHAELRLREQRANRPQP
jgi:short-subunit dehydrogenase